jgi:hypothetical protein
MAPRSSDTANARVIRIIGHFPRLLFGEICPKYM